MNETETMVIKQGDSMELLKELTDESVDCVITDPPYDISVNKNLLTKKGNKVVKADFGEWDKWKSIEDYYQWCVLWVKEIDRVLKKQGSAYIFFSNHYADHITYLIEKETDLRQKAPIVLVKNNPLPHVRKTNFRSAYERLTLFVKDKDAKPKTFNFLSQKEMCNVMFYNIDHKETTHPTEKPLEIISKFVKISTNEGDVILDPFMGSGTTGVSALQLSRNFVGFEMNDEYFKIAEQRISAVTKQGRIDTWGA